MLAEEGDTQVSKIDEAADHDEYAATSPAKRKRSLPSAMDTSMMEDPEREIKRLRNELAHRDHLIRQYESEVQEHEETRRQLYALQQQLQDQQQSQALPQAQG